MVHESHLLFYDGLVQKTQDTLRTLSIMGFIIEITLRCVDAGIFLILREVVNGRIFLNGVMNVAWLIVIIVMPLIT